MKLKYILTISLAVCSLFGSLQAQVSELKEARRLWDKKKYDDAIVIALHALDENPKNETANWLCATAYLKINFYSEAIRYYKKLVELHPSEVSYTNLGGAYAQLGFDEIAMEATEKALEYAPGYYSAISNRAGIHGYHYRIGEALADYYSILELDPSRTNDMFNLAIIYNMAENYADSRIWIDKALSSDPNNADMIMFSERLKKKVDPKYKISKKLTRESITRYTQKIKENRYDDYSVYQLARAYKSLGKKELAKAEFIKALAMYDAAVADMPDAWRKRYLRAGIYDALGETQKAIDDNEIILKVNPNEKTVIERLEKLRKK